MRRCVVSVYDLFYALFHAFSGLKLVFLITFVAKELYSYSFGINLWAELLPLPWIVYDA